MRRYPKPTDESAAALHAYDVHNPQLGACVFRMQHVMQDGTAYIRHEYFDGSAIITTPFDGKYKHALGINAKFLTAESTQEMAVAYGIPAAFLPVDVFFKSETKPGSVSHAPKSARIAHVSSSFHDEWEH